MDDGEQLDEDMDFLTADLTGVSTSHPENLEVSLEDEVLKPSNTAELKGMLQQAGTELTVKYLTGQITFDEYSRHLEKSKSSSQSKTKQQNPVESYDTSNLPNFEIMMDQDYSGEEEESDEDDAEGGDEEEEGEEHDNSSEFLDSGELTDSKDKEWVPSGKSKKAEKEKVEKKTSKPKGRGKQAQGSKDVARKPRKQRRKTFDLPKIMAGTNGKAMLLRAQGKTEEAVQLFYEVIKHAPKAASPYEALGSIHEEKGNMRQAIKFYMLAANLRGRYATEWLDIVDMCLKLNDDKLAMTCFVKGLTAASSNEGKLRILAKRSKYFLEKGSTTKSLQTREQMLPFLDRNNPSNTLAFARDLVHDYLEVKDVNGAISTLQFLTREYANDIDSEDIHSLVELLMDQKSYMKGLEVIIKHCGVTAAFSTGVPSLQDLPLTLQSFASKETTLERLDFPALMPIDLRSKLLQCLVREKVLPSLGVLKGLIESIVSMDADDYGDVHYDIAETMVVCDYHDTALPILEALVGSEKYSEAAVWLTLGQCRNALGDLRAATEAYKRVVDMAPGHHEARVTLSSLLQQMGENEVALQVLSREEGSEQDNQELLLHKCQLLHSQGKTKEFIATALRLLSLNLPSQFNPEMVRLFMNMKSIKSRKNALVARFISQDRLPEDSQYDSKVGKGMSQADKLKFLHNFWEIFMKLCRTLKELGMQDKLMETAALGVSCPVFHLDANATKDVEFLCLKAGPVNDSVYRLARNLASEESNNPQAWNLYNYILTRMKGVGVDFRFTVRCLMKNPYSIPLSILNGNERLLSGTYTQALAEYMAVFKKNPDNDLVLLCSALCLLHIASNPHIGRKNTLILQITSLLNAYRDMRGECQETYYNMGRAWSQLNIQFLAIHFYKKALEFPPAVEDGKGTFDLTKEIAYNLSRVYLRSGNPEYARYYIEKYCVI